MAPGKNKGGKKKGSPKVASSVKDGLNILLKSFRDDETSQGLINIPCSLDCVIMHI